VLRVSLIIRLVCWICGSPSEIGYINLSPPKLELVVQDCDEALKLNPDYVKALNRRATALEQLGQYENALRGMSHSLQGHIFG
jgi:tetratricopeptide (TPR) repeat protein